MSSPRDRSNFRCEETRGEKERREVKRIEREEREESALVAT